MLIEQKFFRINIQECDFPETVAIKSVWTRVKHTDNKGSGKYDRNSRKKPLVTLVWIYLFTKLAFLLSYIFFSILSSLPTLFREPLPSAWLLNLRWSFLLDTSLSSFLFTCDHWKKDLFMSFTIQKVWWVLTLWNKIQTYSMTPVYALSFNFPLCPTLLSLSHIKLIVPSYIII